MIALSTRVKHQRSLSPNTSNLETVSVTVTIDNKDYTIITAYKPPNKQFPVKEYKEIFNNNTNVILLGDLNSKNQAWGCNCTTQQGTKLQSFAVNNNLDVIAPWQPTHYPYNSNIIPDILDIMVSKNFHLPTSQTVLPELDSDHCPVIIELKSSNLLQSNNPFTVLGTKGHVNWNKFRDLLEVNLHYPEQIQTTNEIDNQVTNITQKIYVALLQSTTPFARPFTNNRNPIPRNILNLIKSKRNLRRLWQINRRHDLKAKINKLGRTIKNKLNQIRISNFQRSIAQIHPNSRPLWSTIKRLCKETTDIPILKHNSNVAYTDHMKANMLGKYLQNSFTPNPNTNSSFTNYITKNVLLPDYNVPDKIKFISPSETSKIIKQLKTRKSAGHDHINNRALKELPKRAITILTALFNSCLRLGHFPKDWKLSIILPFCKPGKDPRFPTSYRPISLLPSIAKVFEKLIHSRLSTYLTKISAIPDFQFGFRSQHSTTHQLLRLTEYIANSFHSKKYTIAVFLDIEKAFDKLWHEGLLYKLRQLGTPKYLLHLIRSFLKDRYFSVRINSSLSNRFEINAGVPQGSCLSPLLFTVYMSDLPQSDYTEIALYADDTALFTSHSDISCAFDNIQIDLNNYIKWASNWKIKINASKTQAKIFTLRKLPQPPLLSFQNTNIEWMSGNTPAKYLGVLLDTKLNWKQHIKSIADKTYAKISKLYPIINRNSGLSTDCGLIIYKTIIRPTLTYACPIWNNAAKTNLNKIEIIQNKFLRKIIKAPWFISNIQIQNELNISSINEYINLMTHKFFSSLPQSRSTTIFKLGKTYGSSKRIRSRFPKDSLRPP